MPRKNRTPASSIQNRDNQRRSRARRRDFIDQLQRRLQEYEQRGVEASVEIQRAARAVAWENRHLRALLHRQGISQHDIDAHLSLVKTIDYEPSTDRPIPQQYGSSPDTIRGQRSQAIQRPYCDALHTIAPYRLGTDDLPSLPISPASSSSSFAPRGIRTNSASARSIPPLIEVAGDSADIDDRHQENNSYPKHSVGLQDRTRISYICGNLPDLGNHANIIPPVTDCYCPPDSPIPVSEPMATGTSCGTAMNIIAGLQGHADLEKAREILPCLGSEDCFIQNTKLFQILDKIA